jgi:hypothetical protein
LNAFWNRLNVEKEKDNPSFNADDSRHAAGRCCPSLIIAKPALLPPIPVANYICVDTSFHDFGMFPA